MKIGDNVNNNTSAESSDRRAASRLYECVAGGPVTGSLRDCLLKEPTDFGLPALTLVDQQNAASNLYAGNTFKDGPAAKDQRREQENT